MAPKMGNRRKDYSEVRPSGAIGNKDWVWLANELLISDRRTQKIPDPLANFAEHFTFCQAPFVLGDKGSGPDHTYKLPNPSL